MEILFRQRIAWGKDGEGSLESLGAAGCMVKYISYERDRSLITKKRHYHTGTEIHMIEKGRQIYEIDGQRVELSEGELLTILPGVPHTIVESEAETVKYAIFFNTAEDRPLAAILAERPAFFVESIPRRVTDSLEVIRQEHRRRSAYGPLIIANRALECILTVLCPAGIKGEPDVHDSEEDERLTMAKQYIADNIQRPLSVSEIASYCHIGEKQLTRIFKRCEGVGASEYIRDKRCREIERLLADTDMSLGQISEAMGFANEYYFNTFFKRHSGMSPGAYRRTV